MSNLRLPLPTSHVASTAPSGVLAMNSEDLSSTGTKYPPTPLRPQFNEHTLLTKEHTGSAPLINQNANVRSFRKIPDHNLKHSASIDNIDNISMKSNTSGISGYQYQRQYRKKLQRPKPKIVTGKNVISDDLEEPLNLTDIYLYLGLTVKQPRMILKNILMCRM